jgi:hypothetical protein
MEWIKLLALLAFWVGLWIYIANLDWANNCSGNCNQGRNCDCKTLR